MSFISRRARRCASDETLTIREGALAFRRSSKRSVSRAAPKWLVATTISMPSADSVRARVPPPALLISTSRRGHFCRICSASARTDACDDMSAIISSRSEDPDSRRISSSAACPFSGLRQTITTRAPIWARPRAVSFPMPLFAPVTTQVLPVMVLDWSMLSPFAATQYITRGMRSSNAMPGIEN